MLCAWYGLAHPSVADGHVHGGVGDAVGVVAQACVVQDGASALVEVHVSGPGHVHLHACVDGRLEFASKDQHV